MEGSNLITKLQAKHDLLQKTLGEGQLFQIDGKNMDYVLLYYIVYIYSMMCVDDVFKL